MFADNSNRECSVFSTKTPEATTCADTYQQTIYVQVRFEKGPFGRFVPFVTQYSVHRKQLQNLWYLSIISIAWTACYFANESIQVYLYRWSYFYSLETIMDVSLALAAVGGSLYYIFWHGGEVNPLQPWIYPMDGRVSDGTGGYADWFDAAAATVPNTLSAKQVYRCADLLAEYNNYVLLVSLELIMLSIRMINMLSEGIPGWKVPGATMRLVTMRFASFVFYHICLIAPFIFLFSIRFGSQVPEFRNPWITLWTLLYGFTGVVDFSVFENSQHSVDGPRWLGVFYFVNIFVLLTMFVAIIADAYEEAYDTHKAAEDKAAMDKTRLRSQVMRFDHDFAIKHPKDHLSNSDPELHKHPMQRHHDAHKRSPKFSRGGVMKGIKYLLNSEKEKHAGMFAAWHNLFAAPGRWLKTKQTKANENAPMVTCEHAVAALVLQQWWQDRARNKLEAMQREWAKLTEEERLEKEREKEDSAASILQRILKDTHLHSSTQNRAAEMRRITLALMKQIAAAEKRMAWTEERLQKQLDVLVGMVGRLEAGQQTLEDEVITEM